MPDIPAIISAAEMSSTEGKVITCRAAVAWEENLPLSVETIQVDPPKDGEVRVRIDSTSLCHSDVHYWDGTWKCKFPVILGHEGAGVVESVGAGVTSVSPGDHVIPCFVIHCGECRLCKSGTTNLCESADYANFGRFMPDGTSRFHCKGKDLLHFLFTSTFTEFTVIPESSCAKISPAAPLDKIGLIGCGITTGYGAVVKVAGAKEGSTIAVWGLGGVGLAAIMGAKAAGASKIIGIDINKDKFDVAKNLGATECLNPRDYTSKEQSFEAFLLDHTQGGLDITVECVGNKKTCEEALGACRSGGGVSVVVGVGPPDQKLETVPFNLLLGKIWTGCLFGGFNGRDDIPGMVDKYLKGVIKIDEFITHHFSLEDINESFVVLKKGEAIRSMIHLHKDKV